MGSKLQVSCVWHPHMLTWQERGCAAWHKHMQPARPSWTVIHWPQLNEAPPV